MFDVSADIRGCSGVWERGRDIGDRNPCHKPAMEHVSVGVVVSVDGYF